RRECEMGCPPTGRSCEARIQRFADPRGKQPLELQSPLLLRVAEREASCAVVAHDRRCETVLPARASARDQKDDETRPDGRRSGQVAHRLLGGAVARYRGQLTLEVGSRRLSAIA